MIDARSPSDAGSGEDRGDARYSTEVLERALVVVLLIIHALMLAWSGWIHTPVATEMAHLVAGISHLQLNRFDLLSVNPPFVRCVAALPVVACSPRTAWSRYDTDPLSRSEHFVGRGFVHLNGTRVFWLLTLARWACIPFCLAGASVCYVWGRAAYGRASGLLALILWCFSPYVLGHGSLMIPDVHAAALAVAACYVYRNWLLDPSWPRALVAGVVLGIAELSKSTLLLLYPIFFATWLGWHLFGKAPQRCAARRCGTVMLLAIVGVSLIVLNLGYGGEGSCQRLASFRFHSMALSGVAPWEKAREEGGNRFAASWAGQLPVPLPANYIRGIDKQKSDFEGTQPSFLAGVWRDGGWWYYYLYALALKVPLGTWALLWMAVYLTCLKRTSRASLVDELLLTLPILLILFLVSSQTGFNHHTRYALPVLPFAFVWLSKTARLVTQRKPIAAATVVGFVVWSVVSSLLVYPDSFSYANELAGGPDRGAEYLSESNVAWGQDLGFLKAWLNEHPEAQSLYLKHHAFFALGAIDIASQEMPVGRDGASSYLFREEQMGPRPGWYAVNVCFLHTSTHDYEYLLRFKPVAKVHFSYWIYHITLEEANKVREQYGLPLLPAD